MQKQSTKVNIWSAVPLPCFSLFSDFPIVSRAVAPEGHRLVEYRGYFVHPSVCLSVRLAICLLSYCICWLGSFGLVALAWKLWLGSPSRETLAWRPKPGYMEACRIRGPGLEGLPRRPQHSLQAWRLQPGGLGLGALAWGPWPRGPGLIFSPDFFANLLTVQNFDLLKAYILNF